jgi:pyruvate kinase
LAATDRSKYTDRDRYTAREMERRTKIIATLGPASHDQKTLRRLLAAGTNAIRLNLSHGSPDDHRHLIRSVRQVAASLGRHVPIILDLQGPRYRLGTLPVEGRTLRARQRVVLSDDLDKADVPIGNPELLQHLQPGERVLIGDGMIELKILRNSQDQIEAKVVTGGPIATRKGINLPDSDLPFQISAKDRDDIRLAVDESADYLAASYVGSAADVKAIRRQVAKAGGDLPILAKLERARAVEHIDEIVEAADAVMVARGDLGVEVPLHRVPILQKEILESGRHYGKPVVVATQMLDSMIKHPRPTRAEASDVANTVFDGTDALLLTGETAAGAYPIRAVRTMARIIAEAETFALDRSSNWRRQLLIEADSGGFPEVADAVARAGVFTAQNLGVQRIVAFSRSGFTARLISRYRPSVPVLVFTPDERVARQMQLLWGVHPLPVSERPDTDEEIIAAVESQLKSANLAKSGERLVILMGSRVGDRRPTNMMRIHQIGR